MAIQIPNLGSGNGLTGDNELVIRQKYNTNFTDQTNAASRLVGKGDGQIPLAQNVHSAAFSYYGGNWVTTLNSAPYGLVIADEDSTEKPFAYAQVLTMRGHGGADIQLAMPYGNFGRRSLALRSGSGINWSDWVTFYSTDNTTKDGNGFLKGASPIVDLYSDRIELNSDAEKQNITFEKVSTGNYLIKGSLGFAQEGWYIETPKDANGNVLVAVVYMQLPNKDISIKTYAKRFDEDTGDIVANITKPRDIPAGRFISLRLHELPAEPTTPME